MQKALDAGECPFISLLMYRCTPNDTGLSPADIMFNRKVRTPLPVASNRLTNATLRVANAAVKDAKQRQRYYYDRNALKAERPRLEVGQSVRILPDNRSTDWRPGVITEQLPYRSYKVELPDGTSRRRTSKHVRFSNDPPTVWTPDDMPPPGPPPHSPHSSPLPPRAAPGPADDNRPLPSPDTVASPSPSADRHREMSAAGPSRGPMSASRIPIPTRATMTRSGRVVKPPARYSE